MNAALLPDVRRALTDAFRNEVSAPAFARYTCPSLCIRTRRLREMHRTLELAEDHAFCRTENANATCSADNTQQKPKLLGVLAE